MKKAEKTELTKKKILHQAMQKFGSKGYRGASLNAICEAGIPKGLLYHNFKNKDALYLACVAECFRALTNCFKEAKIGNDLEKYMRVRMAFFNEHEMEARIFFDAVLQPPEALYDQISDLKKEFDALNKTIYQQVLYSIELREGITQGENTAHPDGDGHCNSFCRIFVQHIPDALPSSEFHADGHGVFRYLLQHGL
ncbi:MAG: TetR/AcrR family transcriptional regulator [Bacteroidales bacterium]|nr:TetR/AcrR family transcriptional regulator [Bacteroidales bacterium]